MTIRLSAGAIVLGMTMLWYPVAFAASNAFIPAATRVDMVHDSVRDVVYVTSGTKVLRYSISTGAFLTPYTFNSGNLRGIDISPDGNTLAVADDNITGIHLIDLQTDTIKPDIRFTPDYGEGGTFTVAYGNDGNILVTTDYNGSGSTPLRLVDPRTGGVTVISKPTGNTEVNMNTMLSASGDGRCIGFAESNSSAGPLGIYDVAAKAIIKNLYSDGTSAYNYEIAANRDCTQLAVPTYYGTYIYDSSLAKLGTIGTYAAGRPIAAAYSPQSDVVYFPWAGSSEVRAYDTRTYTQLGAFDVGYAFQNTGNYAFNQGRIKVSRDGSLFLVTVGEGVAIRSTSLAPSASPQALFTSGTAPLAITLTGSSPKKYPLTYTVVTSPPHGVITGTPPAVTYTPQAGFSGTDSFTFKVSDGSEESATAEVAITVDRMAPVVTAFSVPASASSLTVSIESFAATDAVGVAGYCVTENPTAASCSWSGTPAATHRFASAGDHTLYAFAKDAAGNISTAASATTTIDRIVPRITAFRVPASYDYDNPTVAVTLTATDDFGVTGYCITEATTADGCSWSYYAPSSYTFGTVGPHTLHAFARNSAGNVSPPATATTTALGRINFIPAASRKDMVYDVARGILYITSGTQVLRYQLTTNSFLTPFTFGLGNLHGIDLSPDGKTLAIADLNITGVHLVDLDTGTAKQDVTFPPAISGEGGTFSVAFGNDGALLTTSTYLGSGWAPLRRIDPATRTVTTIKSMISQDSMLSPSADRTCIGYTEGNTSGGPLSLYDVATKSVTNTVRTDWFTFETGTNRNCTQFAVPTYGGTFIYDSTLSKTGTVGTYAGGQPIGVAYHPTQDLVYFSWAGSREVRAFDTTTFEQVGAYDAGYSFTTTGNDSYVQGRVKIAGDGSLLFVTVGSGLRYQRLGTGPFADNQSVSGYMATSLPITLTGSSSQNRTLAYTIVTPPAHGSLQGTPPNLMYVPEPSYTGTDTIVFKVSDGLAESVNASLTINLRPIPTGVTVAAPTVNDELTLTWNSPSGAAFSTFRIYRSTVAGELGQRIATGIATTSYTDRGLASQTTYYYTVRVVDASGIESTNTGQVSGTTLDSVPPVTTATPAGGTFQSAQQVTLTASEPVTVYFTTDGTMPTTASPAYQGPILIDATTVLRYFAVDAAGNAEAVRTQTYTVRPPSLPPKISLSVKVSGTTKKIAGIEAEVTLPSGVTVPTDPATGMSNAVSRSALELRGGWATSGQVTAAYRPAQPATGTTGGLPATVVVAAVSPGGVDAGEVVRLICDVAPGTHADASPFQVRILKVVDADGVSISGILADLNVVVDLIPPSLNVSALPDRAVTKSAVVNVAGNVSDAGGISAMVVNGLAVPVSANGGFSAAVLLASGANTITTEAVDNAGNSTIDKRTVSVDWTAPPATITTPADNSSVGSTTAAIAGTAAADATVEVKCNGLSAQTITRDGAAFGAVVTLGAGLNTVEIIVSDMSGKTNTLKRSIFCNIAGPSLAITYPPEDSVTSSSTVTLSGIVSDAMGTGGVTVYVNGQSYSPQVISGAFEQEIALPAESSYEIVVTAAAEGGETSSVKRNIVYKLAPSGDVSGDGRVDIVDALLALRVAVGLVATTDAILLNGDVAPFSPDGRPAPDGKIDVSDAVLILMKTVGLRNW